MKTEAGTKLEKTAWNLFTQNDSLYEPLQILSYKTSSKGINRKTYSPDAYLTLAWKGQKYKFNVEVTGNLYLEAKLAKLKQIVLNNEDTMIIVPYLTKGISELIKQEQINCIDLSGNYYIQRDDLLAIRLDQPDQFKSFSRIRKAYAGSSSILGRLLLSDNLPKLPSLAKIRTAIIERGGSIVFSTMSKVLTEMERDQIILKTEEDIKLLQPRKLLEKLVEQYRPPSITKTIKIKCPGDPVHWLNERFQSWVRTGESSVNRYAITTPDQFVSVYVSKLPEDYIAEERFFNLILNVTNDDFIFFDYKEDVKTRDMWSSPVQSYLELIQLDKREKEIAETIKAAILSKYE